MAGVRATRVLRRLQRLLVPHNGDEQSDVQLLRRFAERRDEAAFETLLRQHGPMVFGVCQRVLGHRHEAEDAFQAAFLVLVRKARAIARGELLAQWLYGVAYRCALKARTLSAKRRLWEKQGEAMPHVAAKPLPEWSDLEPVLDEELSRLPDKYRLPIVLCYLQGKTNTEAAEELGWTKGTVSGRLARARDLLRDRLTRRGVTLSAAAVSTLLEQAASAGMPSSLVGSTLRVADPAAAGSAAAGVVSTHVLAIADGVLKTMLATKLKMMTLVVVVFGAFLTGAGVLASHLGDSDRPTPEKETAAKPMSDDDLIQGTWSVSEVAISGLHQAKEESTKQKWVITRDKIVITYEDGSTREMTFKLDSTKKPKSIDLTVHGGLDKTTMPGIYELTGDQLKICWENGGPRRPARFGAGADSGQFFVLERLPPQREQPRTDLELIQGTWAVVSFEWDGHTNESTDMKGCRWIIKSAQKGEDQGDEEAVTSLLP